MGAPRTTAAPRLLYRGYKRYVPHIAALAGLGLASGFFEAIGISAFIPAFSFLIGGEASDPVSRILESVFSALGITFTFRYLVLFALVLFFCRTAVLLLSNYTLARVLTGYQLRARSILLEKTLAASWPFLLKERIGHLETMLVTHVDYCQRLLKTMSNGIVLTANVLMYLLAAFIIAPALSAITLVAALAFSAVVRPLGTIVRRLSKSMEVVSRDIAHLVSEHIVGMKVVKAMHIENAVAFRARESFRAYRDLRLRSMFLSFIPGSFMQPLGLLFVLLLFSLSYGSGSFNLAAFAAVVYLIQRIFVHAEQVQGNLLAVSESLPYLRTILEYEDALDAHTEGTGGTAPFSFEKEIAFRDVRFSYPDRPEVLHGVSFSVRKGESVGLVGSSGAGKTTISDLLLRLFSPSAGSITVDGVPLEEFSLKEWRATIGYVPQDIFLLNDTVANNISVYDDTLTRADIEEAARLAHLSDVLARLPEGLDTVVGEKGVTLSAGQRQRVVLARALVRKPALLILDEATSALDTVSEATIQDALEEMRGKVTTLTIAHRLSTVMKADRVLVLEEGVVAEEGEPQVLRADERSRFSALYRASA